MCRRARSLSTPTRATRSNSVGADFFDRPRGGDKTLLVALSFPNDGGEPAREEFVELVGATDAQVVGMIGGQRKLPDPRCFAGSGKVEEIARVAEETCAELIIFNHQLSPAQERNLEARIKARVLDRNGLILDIFARRAQTHEGKLQVELAQLRHLSTRLVRGWTHLERQKGGIGLRGPGESQLETDRRLIGDRIKHVERRIEQVRHSRQLNRRHRQRRDVPIVSLVGYTNAGKSTLFERLTGSDTYVADKLFATLDTTLRRVALAGGESAVLADTVGFIRDLPHTLVAAFRATLEESAAADLLLHVVDASDPERDEQSDAVITVLEEIDADQVPRLEVYNKLDCLPDQVPRVDRNKAGVPCRVWVSAADGAGIELLQAALVERLLPDMEELELALSPDLGRLRARLFRSGAVTSEHCDDAGLNHLQVAISRRHLERMCAEEGVNLAGLRA